MPRRVEPVEPTGSHSYIVALMTPREYDSSVVISNTQYLSSTIVSIVVIYILVTFSCFDIDLSFTRLFVLNLSRFSFKCIIFYLFISQSTTSTPLQSVLNVVFTNSSKLFSSSTLILFKSALDVEYIQFVFKLLCLNYCVLQLTTLI